MLRVECRSFEAGLRPVCFGRGAATQQVADVLTFGDVTVDLRRFEARRRQGVIKLKEKEIMILRLLAERDGEPVDRETILDRVWGYDFGGDTRAVDSAVKRLRAKLRTDSANADAIEAVRGVGYRFNK